MAGHQPQKSGQSTGGSWMMAPEKEMWLYSFIRMLETSTNQYLKLTQEFMHLLSIIDISELKRNAEIRTKLTEILEPMAYVHSG
jgi:hypothetical protein